MSYNSPRFNGDVSATIAEREDLSVKLSKELEASLEEAGLDTVTSTDTSSTTSSSTTLCAKSDVQEERGGGGIWSWFNRWRNYQTQNTEEAEKDSGSGGEIDKKAPGSAGVRRMQQYFLKILPPNTPHAVVSLQPAKPLPWKYIGVGVGAVLSMTAMVLIVKSRRLK